MNNTSLTNTAEKALKIATKLEKSMAEVVLALEDYGRSLERVKVRAERNTRHLTELAEQMARIATNSKKFKAIVDAHKLSMDFIENRQDNQDYEMLVLKRSTVELENTVNGYADAYKVNNENISILNERVVKLEKRL